ncbi:hypothetical protein [Polaromonas sp. A23]|uniref:hypothetical protein n=1 Tax=Polaromonas sp. A23 TaxID=1944133 RepID=UPI00098773F6|nr:hypothetical protein [Polaromonas sp. A23]OOG46377.1 hypothetical protein B0B52_03220 [Polaromonas sp. A23]
MTACDQLTVLSNALQQLSSDALGVAAFSRLAQNQPELRAALPTRYTEVLFRLMHQLRSP